MVSLATYVGFSTFGGDIFRVFQINVFLAIDLRRSFGDLRHRPLMHGRAIHEWTSFIEPIRRRRRRLLTCDKLSRSSKW